MKFFNKIVATTLFGTSLIIVNPAEANDWTYIGHDRNGYDRHARILMKKGGVVAYEFAWKNMVKKGVILCERNQIVVDGTTYPVIANTFADTEHKIFC
jgi:hypothetical protein